MEKLFFLPSLTRFSFKWIDISFAAAVETEKNVEINYETALGNDILERKEVREKRREKASEANNLCAF